VWPLWFRNITQQCLAARVAPAVIRAPHPQDRVMARAAREHDGDDDVSELALAWLSRQGEALARKPPEPSWLRLRGGAHAPCYGLRPVASAATPRVVATSEGLPGPLVRNPGSWSELLMN